MPVEFSADRAFEPDAMLRCGAMLSDDALSVTDTLVFVEVLSPFSVQRDHGSKLVSFFSLPSLRHDLIVDAKRRALIHDARDAAGAIITRIIHDGPVILDPPGITLVNIFP